MSAAVEEKSGLMQKLNREAAKIAWHELQTYFASGKTVFVDPALDLIDTAAEIALDNKASLEPLIQSGQIAPVSDPQAQSWFRQNTLVWAVVVAPMVLVQPAS